MSIRMRYWLVFILMILGLIAASPVENIQDLIDKLEAYSKEYPQVRVHLIFNQPKYAPGDTAYFKAYFLTEDFRPIPDKQILTLELKDGKGNNVHVQNFRVVEGEGSNQVIFSNTIIPGEYRITVYSEWMRNFDPALFYRKNILITGRKQLIRDKDELDSLSFYPEGGHLIEGIENKVTVKSSRQGKGKILNQTGVLVCEFQFDERGIAEVAFTPAKNLSYYGVLPGINKEFPLTVTEDGCALRVSPLGASGVNILFSISPSSSFGRQELNFLALSKGRVIYSTPLRMENNPASISVSSLHPGLNQFYVFDRKNNRVAERIYYVPPSSARAMITSNDGVIGPRELVNVEVALTDEVGREIAGSFTTRAVASTLFPDSPAASLECELNLFNDLPDLRNYFEKSGLTEEEWLSKLDALLITQKWKRINWEEVLNLRKNKPKYPFKYSLDLKGKAFFKETGDPVPDSTLILLYQQKGMVGYEAYVSKKGELAFPFLYDFSGTDHVFYMMEFKKREKQEDYHIEPEVVISNVNETTGRESENSDLYGEYKFRKKLIDNSFAFYADPDKKIESNVVNPNLEFEDELGGADVTIKVDEFLVFPTMQDLIHEVITGLQVRSLSDKPIVRVVFIRNTYTVIPKGDPLYIIDGIFTKNTNFFLSLNPEDVYTIKLISNENKLQRFGGLGKYGIVIVQTKKSIAKQVIESSTMFPISGLSKEIEFKSPFYSSPISSRKPDLRSSIYWNPKISTGSNGKVNLKFYTSDDASLITIEVQGFTIDGRAFSARQMIKVKAPEIRP